MSYIVDFFGNSYLYRTPSWVGRVLCYRSKLLVRALDNSRLNRYHRNLFCICVRRDRRAPLGPLICLVQVFAIFVRPKKSKQKKRETRTHPSFKVLTASKRNGPRMCKMVFPSGAASCPISPPVCTCCGCSSSSSDL